MRTSTSVKLTGQSTAAMPYWAAAHTGWPKLTPASAGNTWPTTGMNKAGVMAAVCRAAGIPARLGYADVRNHMTTRRLSELMGSDVEFLTDEQRIRPEKSEVFRLWCDNTKIRELTGFEPEFSIEDGLSRTIDWFTKPQNLAKYKADIYNV